MLPNKTALDWVVANAEKLGVVAILIIIIMALSWMLKKIYEQGRSCEEARLDDAKERAAMNKELGGLAAEVKTLKNVTNEVKALRELNEKTLKEALYRNDGASR
jgi:hypothetical protein